MNKTNRFMRAALIPVFICLAVVVFPSSGNAEQFHNALSFQGFTGLINIPNAEVTEEGIFYTVYDNQIDSVWRQRTTHAENSLFSFGFLPHLELGGRYSRAPWTDHPGKFLRDLSANVKVQIQSMPQGSYFPDIAFGAQDIASAGKNNYFQTRYVVATEQLWRFRMSVGYGFGPHSMQGVFYGAEVKAFDWLYLLGENDTRERNLGVRVVTSELLGLPVNLQFTAKTSLDYQRGHMEYGFGLRFPIGGDYNNRKVLPEKENKPESESIPSPSEVPAALSPASSESGTQISSEIQEPKTTSTDQDVLRRLLTRLTREGFENVRVGTRRHELLVVEYENERYNYNEIDGLGVVLGIVTETIPSGFDTLRLVIKKEGIRTLQLSAPLDLFRVFLHDPDKYSELNKNLRITPEVDQDSDVAFIDGPDNSSWLKSTLMIYPLLTTVIGAELGNGIDYALSARLDYYLHTWKGSVLNARWNRPISWTENFDDNKAFAGRRGKNELERLMLFQAIKVSPHLMFNLGGGMVLHDSYGILNEAAWTPGEGTHRFAVRQAHVTNNQGLNPTENTVYLGSYRYFYSPLDFYLELTAGRFYYNDEGFSLEAKRFFGDSAISLIYKNTLRAKQYWDWTGKRDQMVGVQITLPLTPRRDMKPGLLQVKGYDAWSYLQETKVSPNNYLVTVPVALNPIPAYNIDRVFYNRDRLSEPYIRAHLLRLRDAYITYREKVQHSWSRTQ